MNEPWKRESKTRRRVAKMSTARKREYDRMMSSLPASPQQALETGTPSEKRTAIKSLNIIGDMKATENKNLDGVDQSGINNDGRSYAGSSLSNGTITRASGANFNGTTSFNLNTRGGDTSGSSWNMATIISADARNSNRRNQNMESTLQAFNNSSGSDSENIRISGFGIANQHGGEILTGSTISGWQIASSYNGAFAQGATITGRADMNDYSDMDISKGTLNVHSPLAPIVAHNLKATGATIGLGRTENAASANLDDAANILNANIEAMVEDQMVAKLPALPARRDAQHNRYEMLKMAEAPRPQRRAALNAQLNPALRCAI